MGNAYKDEKEAFVSGMTGSSITYINLISLVALASVCLYASIRTRLRNTLQRNFLFSWLLLVLPLLLAMTSLATRPVRFGAFLSFLAGSILLKYSARESGTPLPSAQPSSPLVSATFNAKTRFVRVPPLPALTTYRAHMMLMTTLAILAVDFPIFPRVFVKCETWGTSLMDLGVGSFVFSQGIVTALPLLRNPSHITAPLLPKLISVTHQCIPVIILGLVRVILVKGTEYPEHVTEYGVHWNFFLTLAFVPILQVLLHPILARWSISFVGITIALVQQLLLSKLELQDYVLYAPRNSLASANKEGVVSLLGYLSIHLLGLSVGTLVLAPTPSFFKRGISEQRGRKRRNSDPQTSSSQPADLDITAPRQLDKTATELCAYAILWWSAVGITGIPAFRAVFFGKESTNGGVGIGAAVSRQMVNLPYVFWVAAYNTSFLLLYILALDMGIFAPNEKPKSKKRTTVQSELESYPAIPSPVNKVGLVTSFDNPPRLLDVINKHSLPVFLLANVLTGLINLSMKTMYASDTQAMVVLILYSLAVTGAPWLFESRKRR